MDILTPLLVPVAKGILGSTAVILLGGGGYIVYKKYKIDYPLTDYLEEVTATAEKKVFSKSSLVSRHIRGNGVVEYRYKIPTGYSVKDMLDLKPAIEDKFDCEIQVWAESKNFVVEMLLNPIPKEVTFDSKEVKNVLSNYECAMYLGKSRKGDMVIDFTENLTPHLLFSAPTGGGKSNLLNQGICGMIETYTPEQLHLYLIDMKNGVEFAPYENVEHVKGFYETVTQVDTGLREILLEIKRRNELFKEVGVKKLVQYNSMFSEEDKTNILPRIVVIADEFAQFNNIAEKEVKKNMYLKWEELIQLGRSTGIHVVIGTQVADADVFPKQIKGNIDARFGFKFKDPQHSKMVSGGSELTTLPNIIGRGMFILGSNFIQTQVPYIDQETFNEIIERHQREEEVHAESIDEKTMDSNEAEERNESLPENETVSEPSGIENLFLTEEQWKMKNPANVG